MPSSDNTGMEKIKALQQLINFVIFGAYRMVFRILITHKLTNDYEQKVIRICFFTIFVFNRIWSKTFFPYAIYGNIYHISKNCFTIYQL